ncbi:hypothetical protein NLJ89_g4490 [Agrocybe chaxingu]|uniref:Ubiquitin-like domain-containing protein n=1 Tax=Agrocybe chaxingu TaxID=84603 RepID=A0A9W8K9M9_9AGAR|nr:hypothetical protein NLJ89_g4490 [Agrocybe chaxingu]
MALAPSIGDLVTLGNVIASIVKAVNETSGASAEYQELVAELTAFCDMVYFVKDTLGTVSVSPSNQAALNLIHGEVLRCRALVNAFVDTIRPYHQALNATGGTSRRRHSLRVIFRKVWWRSSGRKMSRRFSLSFIVQITTSTQMTTKVGFGREHGLEIVDLMGKTFSIPWELCFPWDKLRVTLKSYYQDTPGQTQVEWGDYTLFCEDLADLQVDVYRQFKQLKKGMKLTMAALTWRQTPTGRLSEYKCTRCPRSISVDPLPESGWVECPGCGRKTQLTMQGTKFYPWKRTYGYQYIWYGYPRGYVNHGVSFDNLHVVVEHVGAHIRKKLN